MSATFHLFKISSADYLGSPFELKTEEEIREDIRRRLNLPDDYTVDDIIHRASSLGDSFALERTEWSDETYHHLLDITSENSWHKGERSWRRVMKRLNTLPTKTYKDRKYVALDEVEYAQGWFLKKRFFRKETTVVYCVTKEQMRRFFEQYLDFTGDYASSKYVYDKFMNSWQDGMIFECAW